ncbi:hypothetical protein D770_08445 [Flammeovirgaceae bacterium 311]|nr:hypothetical protein D770_08445 [Flammeovirgaceae bacterium 311]
MNKPIVKNWMKYWASTLAVSGMLVMGACATSEDRRSDDVATNDVETTDSEYNTGVDRQDVNRPVVEGEYAADESASMSGTESTTGITTTTGTEGTAITGTTTTGTTGTTTAAGTQDNQDNINTSTTVSAQDDATTSTTAGTQYSTGTSTAGTQQSTGTTASTSTNQRSVNAMSGGGTSTSIDRHIQKFSEVNQAIEESLASLSAEERGMQSNQYGTTTGSQQSGANQGMNNTNMQSSESMNRQNVSDAGSANTYDNMNATGEDTASETMRNADRMSNTQGVGTTDDVNRRDDANVNLDNQNMATTGTTNRSMVESNRVTDQDLNTLPETAVVVYEVYAFPEDQLTEEERALISDARANIQISNANASFVTARPDVNYSELVEEIEEEMRLPEEMKDAKMEGTVLVQFVVDEKGEIESAEVIDGIIRQTKEDGTLMSMMKLTDKAQEGVQDEIANEDLIEFKGEDKERIVEALKQESLRAVNTTSGRWQAENQEGEPEKMMMIMPIRFDIED